jgi:hypothetical protein
MHLYQMPNFSTTTRPRHAWVTITSFTNFLLSNLPNFIDLSLCRSATECWQSAVFPKLRAVDIKNIVVTFAEFAQFLTLPTLEKLSIGCIQSDVHHPEFLIQDLRSIDPRNCKIKDLYVEETEIDLMPTDVFEAFLKVFVCLRRFRWYRKKPMSVAWENVLQHALNPFKKTLNMLILDVFYPPSLQGPENVMQEPLRDLSTFPQLRILHISPDLLKRSYIPKKSILSLPGRRRKIGQYQPLTAISDVFPKSVAILTLHGDFNVESLSQRYSSGPIDYALDFWFNLVGSPVGSKKQLPLLQDLRVATIRSVYDDEGSCVRCSFKETKHGCYMHHPSERSERTRRLCLDAGIMLWVWPGTHEKGRRYRQKSTPCVTESLSGFSEWFQVG